MILKCKTYFTKNIFFNEKVKILNFEKTPCQKVDAMVTSNLTDKHLLRQIVPRQILAEVANFGGFKDVRAKNFYNTDFFHALATVI